LRRTRNYSTRIGLLIWRKARKGRNQFPKLEDLRKEKIRHFNLGWIIRNWKRKVPG